MPARRRANGLPFSRSGITFTPVGRGNARPAARPGPTASPTPAGLPDGRDGHDDRAEAGQDLAWAHPPLRPLWLCRACQDPWPCPTARQALAREYARDRVSLCLMMSQMMFEADADLTALNPDDPPPMSELFRRFLTWARRVQPSG